MVFSFSISEDICDKSLFLIICFMILGFIYFFMVWILYLYFFNFTTFMSLSRLIWMQIKACLNSLELNLRLVGLKLGHFIYALFSYVFVFEIKKKGLFLSHCMDFWWLLEASLQDYKKVSSFHLNFWWHKFLCPQEQFDFHKSKN